MNRIRHVVFAVALLGWLTPSLADDEPLERIRSIASAAVSAQASPSAQLSADSLDPRLRLPLCAETPLAEPPSHLRGSTITVAVRCTSPSQWTVHVPVRLRDPRTVLVLSRAVRAGEAASDELFTVQERDVALLPFGFVDDLEAARGMQFKRALAAGTTPSPADLAAPHWVKRGQLVQLLSRAGGIEVRAEGKALVDGSAGQRIRVENRGSKRIIEGLISAPGFVEVAM